MEAEQEQEDTLDPQEEESYDVEEAPIEEREATVVVGEDSLLEEKGARLDKYIAGAFHLSRKVAAQIIEEGKVKINGTTINKTHYKVKPKDALVALLPINDDQVGDTTTTSIKKQEAQPDLGRKRGRKRRNMPNTRKMLDKQGKRDNKTKKKNNGKKKQQGVEGGGWTLSERAYQEVLNNEEPLHVQDTEGTGAEEGAETTESPLVNPEEVDRSLRDAATLEKVVQEGYLVVDGSYLEG